jgi:uncharacterized protein YlxP (DUF503 family)
MIGVLHLNLLLPGCASLKEKRGRLKPLLARLHRQFNVSSAEMGLQDKWQETVIACGMVGNDAAFLQSALETVRKWVEANWPDGDVLDTKIELL